MASAAPDERPARARMALPLLALAIACAASLVSGAAFLETRLPGGLPLGNLVAAALLVALAWSGRQLSVPGTAAARFAGGAALLAVAWLPLSVALAGNLALDFYGKTGTLWGVVTCGTLLAALVALAWGCAQHLARRRAGRSPTCATPTRRST